MVAIVEKTATQQERPIDRFLSLLRGYDSYTSLTHDSNRGYTTNCPGPDHRNGDSKPSLMIWENEDGSVGLKCHAGCKRSAICEALSISEQDLYPQDGKYHPKRIAHTLDLVDLALDKHIDPRMLVALGVTDNHTWKTAKGKEWKNVVRIPYTTLDGSEHNHARIRTALTAKEGSYWEGEGELLPYGLHRLITKTSVLTIVEGESDCWTLWQWGLAALGVPGANNTQCLQKEHVDHFPSRVYVVKEPSAPGKLPVGERFVKSVAAQLHKHGYQGEVYRLDLDTSHHVKDPNALNKQLFAENRASDFPVEWQNALNAAQKVDMADKAIALPEIIVVGRQYRDVAEDALMALSEGDRKDPTIFVKEGRLIQLARDEKRNPLIKPMGIPEIRNALTRTANYFRVKTIASTEEVLLVPISPPKELAEYILAMNPIEWPFPALAGVIEMPIMRPDGSILDTPGYDEVTSLYYVANDQMKHCKIPHQPTKAQMQEAVALIHQCIGEFPYETTADYANMFGLLLTLVTRYMYTGDVMTALINATKQGTGKSLLAQFAGLLATGRPPAMTSFPEKEEETKKVIDSKVLSGNSLIVFDNVKRTFQSAALDMLTTCGGWYSVRPLGKTQDIAVYTQMTVIATGNNVQLDSDQARRCYQIRLVSPVSNPDEREDITIKRLLDYGREHRAELVAALLTLARGWYVDDKPAASNKLARSASSYSDWCNTVGGILEHAGISGFQENRDALKAEANSEEQQIAAFLRAWHDQFGDSYIPAVEVVKIIKHAGQTEEKAASLFEQTEAKGEETHPLFETLPEYLKTTFYEPKEKSIQSCTVSLTKWLVKRVKTPFGPDNIRVEYTVDTHKCQKLWRVVVPEDKKTPPTPSSHKEEEQQVTTNPSQEQEVPAQEDLSSGSDEHTTQQDQIHATDMTDGKNSQGTETSTQDQELIEPTAATPEEEATSNKETPQDLAPAGKTAVTENIVPDRERSSATHQRGKVQIWETGAI